MVALNTNPNLPVPDDFYEALLNGHAGLSEAQTHELNAMLVLLLANHIGDTQLLQQAIQKARHLLLEGSG
jgi:Protein of unknown function (DUF2783)